MYLFKRQCQHEQGPHNFFLLLVKKPGVILTKHFQNRLGLENSVERKLFAGKSLI